ncbi:oligoribonuclease [Jiangella alkaliphila]|uniref:Oligoribonuclease n=2 Tax=Jiangella alkaliphila TaxID=419479 RepID=A0A1H2LPM1_9ACTN|nr:oligoribonuclease [Jiangella alkaliphila]SDU82792.1 oligoribonuclease [Jiangella alkaliphila]
MTNDRMVWIDCEMTGLDLQRDALVEVAVLVTDAELNVLGDGVDVVIRPPDDALEQMNDVVRQMHTASGLLTELAGGVTMDEANTLVMQYIKAHVPEPSKAQLAGNTVHMDRLFLARDLPEVEGWLHYRNIDVSSIKELVRRWYPRVYFASPTKTGNHRALGDIKDSIDELRYYRRTVFVPLPGPDSTNSRAAAVAIMNEARAAQTASD